MSLLVGTVRKDVRYIRKGSTEIKSVWWGLIKVWPMAKLYFLNTGDETLEYNISNESAAKHSASGNTVLKLRAMKSEIKLPFSYVCSSKIAITAIAPANQANISNTAVGASGNITLNSNKYASTDQVTSPDFLITWTVEPNTTLTTQTSTIVFKDLLDNIDNANVYENCDVDPITFTIVQRPDTVLWEQAVVKFYTDANCTTAASSYKLNQYTSGTVDVFFRIEAKRESGLTYYYGQGVFGTEGATDLTVTRGTTSVATSATTPTLVNTTTYCWKTTISISDNSGCWGQWSQGSIAYSTNATYTANSTQSVTVTHPKRTWIGTSAKSSRVTITMKHTDDIADRPNQTTTISGYTTVNQNADTRTTSETDSGVKYYCLGGDGSLTTYNIVKYQTVTVACTQGATATITYDTSGLSGTLYAEFIMDPTYYASGHLTGQVDTTTSIGSSRTKTFTARSTGTATVYVIIRQLNTDKKSASISAPTADGGKAGTVSVNTTGVVTWGSANGDATQVAWKNELTLTHTECAYAPASGYDYSNVSSSGNAKIGVTVASETIYMKFTLKSAGNAISVGETSYAASGTGDNGSRNFNLTWKSNLGSWAAWPDCSNSVYNISYGTNATYSANSTQSVTKQTPTRAWNTTTRKQCTVTCDAYCGNDAKTRSITIVAYWATSNEEARATATQNGTVRIYTSKDIVCYQKADTQTNANATANGRGAYQATPTFSISGNANATVNSSTGVVTWSTANGDGTQISFTQGVTWSDCTTCAYNATSSSGKATAKVNVTTEPVYMYFTLTTAGNATSCTNTTAATGGNGTGSRTTTITWKSNKGYYDSWTSSVTMPTHTTDFKSGTYSMAKSGSFYRTYNTTTKKTCVVTAYAYAGKDEATRSATVTVKWTRQGTSTNPVSGSTECSKTATATQNGTVRVYSEKAYTFEQSADTTQTQYDSGYTYSLTTANTGASVNSSSGLVTFGQNGGVADKNVAYILGTLTGTATISPTSHAFDIDGSSKEFSASGVSTSAGTSGSAANQRAWTITVTGTDSGLTKSGTLTQTGLSTADVTAPTPSFTYNWSISGTGFSRNTASGTKTTVTAAGNGGSAGTWGSWSKSGSIAYATNAGYSANSTQSPSTNTFTVKRTRTVSNTSARSGTLTLTINGTNVSNSITKATASLSQNGRTYGTTDYDSISFSVSGTGASMNNSSTGQVKWTSNAASSVAKPTVGNKDIGYSDTSGSVTVSGCSSGVTYTASISGTGSSSATLSSDKTSVSFTCGSNKGSTGTWGSWSSSGSLTYGDANPCANNTVSPSTKPSISRSRTVTSTDSRKFTITVSGSTSTSSRSAKVTATAASSGFTAEATCYQDGDSNSNSGSGTVTQGGHSNTNSKSESDSITYSESNDNCTVNSSSGVVTWSSANGTSRRSATISWVGTNCTSCKGTGTAYQKANSWSVVGISEA